MFIVALSSPSYAKWTKVIKDTNGNTYYIDLERIRKVDGYVYWWDLKDLLKPNKYGLLSGKAYNQGDCKLFRIKILNYVHHTQPMGRDVGEASNPKNPEWQYPPPNSVNETILKAVCAQ